MGYWQEFQGVNAGYVLELYDRFRNKPSSVDAATRAYFEHWTPPAEDAPGSPAKDGELFLSVGPKRPGWGVLPCGWRAHGD